jgi:hypothetical protein
MRGFVTNLGRARVPFVLAVSALLALTGVAGASWDGTQSIRPGDRISAEFAAGDASQHSYSLFAPKDTLLTVKAKADSGLVLAFSLTDERMASVDLGGTASATGIRAFRIPASGTYMVGVNADSGSGVYYLQTSAKSPAVLKASTEAGFQFGAPRGSVMTASLKPSSGSDAEATFTSLSCPGDSVAITPGTKLAGVALPDDATYTLGIGYQTAGPVDLLIKVKYPKSKRTWSFGTVEAAPGSISEITAKWKGSAHGDRSAEAFHHWDSKGQFAGSDQACAKCHSRDGFLDWIGGTGKTGDAFETLDFTASTGTVIDCEACHNLAASTLSTVLFPSGKRIDNLGSEARCLQCHQGRESTVSVDAAIATAAVGDDAEMAGQSFLNVHYLAAGATFYGREAEGGYQYAGKEYNGKLAHVADFDNCIQCHDQHGTTVRISDCAVCHQPGGTPVASVEDLRNIRMKRSVADYDGDGSTTEGIAGELDGLAARLYTALQAYGTTATHPLVYDAAAYPYFFNDTNANGVVDSGEATYANKYSHWTPRLLRAAYNYQFWKKDPGAFAHNSRYVMQLLYDAIEDVGGSTTGLTRGDAGHFDALGEPFRDWDGDSDDLVNTPCSQCHSQQGFAQYVTYTTSSTEITNPPPAPHVEGFPCETCHMPGKASFGTFVDGEQKPPLRYVAAVWFPASKISGGKKLSNNPASPDPSFVCMTCHQGRESKDTVDSQIATGTYKFLNVHYLPAGAMLYGKDAGVGYEYTGKTYASKFAHFGGATSQCTYCHLRDETDHTFQPKLNATCQVCHGNVPIEDVRLKAIGQVDDFDYDGDGDTTETLGDELSSFRGVLLTAIQTIATASGKPVAYDAGAYPYWFADTNGNGVHDADETTTYAGWTPALMKAAFNYQFSVKDPGAWAHNRKYIAQLLYDSIQDLGQPTGTLQRP